MYVKYIKLSDRKMKKYRSDQTEIDRYEHTDIDRSDQTVESRERERT